MKTKDGPRYVFVTGTDTGVGKTEFTVALTRMLRARGTPAVALKPLSSGDRSDAERLERAMEGALPLDWINPWTFTAPLSPLLAARQEGRRVAVGALLRHVRETSKAGDPVIVEGAGGLLSPLLEGADAPELIEHLDAWPVVVARDRLGVVNQVRLVWEALPKKRRGLAQVILMTTAGGDASSPGNRGLLAEYLPANQIHAFPWLGDRRGRVATEELLAIALEGVAAGLEIPRPRVPGFAKSRRTR